MKGVTLTYDASEVERIEGGTPKEAAATKTIRPNPVNTSGIQTIRGTLVQPATAINKIQSYSSGADQSSSMGKRELILSLIDASGARENMNQMFTQILSQAPADQGQKLREVFSVDEVISQLVPIYDKYFTEDELKGLINFYKSPLGHKLLTVTPLIMQDSMTASVEYFQNKMPATQGQQ